MTHTLSVLLQNKPGALPEYPDLHPGFKRPIRTGTSAISRAGKNT